MTGGSGQGAGRPELTDEEAAARAVRIIDVALALKRGVSDAELVRRWQLSRRQAVALVGERQRHPLVVAFLGDSVESLQPKRKLLYGAARLAIALVEADEKRELTGAVGEKPRLKMTAAIQLAARRVRVARRTEGLADPAKNKPKITIEWGEVDIAGVSRAVKRIKSGKED